MATMNKITEIIAAIKTIYPYYAKDTDIETLVKTWNMLLRDYPDEAVNVAFYKCLQTCKMPPTPADVIENLNAIAEANEETDESLWGVYTKALREVERQIYYIQYPKPGEDAREKIQNAWEALPWKIREYIGSKGELMRMAKNYDDEELKYEKTRFLKTMPTIRKREKYNELNLLIGSTNLYLTERT